MLTSARQGNLRTDLVSGGGWDQLVLPLATCVSYAKDLAPLAYNDQARCDCMPASSHFFTKLITEFDLVKKAI